MDDFFHPKFGWNPSNGWKKKKMLVGLDWCQTCTLSSRIWKKLKTTKISLNWSPLTHFIPNLPQGMQASACAWTSEARKIVQAPNNGGWSLALSTAIPPTCFFFPFLPSFFFPFSSSSSSPFFLLFLFPPFCYNCHHPKTPRWKKHTKETWKGNSSSLFFLLYVDTTTITVVVGGCMPVQS